ncbi:NAD-dependent histone deacetylase domain containing protein [Aphelenchoides besseyi]|nr:NAD-dependent histone deacetylase domain containing protein [Aphelenchoides besseyi]
MSIYLLSTFITLSMIVRSTSNQPICFFPILLRRAPDSISTEIEILKTIRWINRGILTSQSIASVVFSCCSGVIERAFQLNLLSTLIREVFVQSNEPFVHSHWCTAISAFGGKMKTYLLDEFERLSLLVLPVDELKGQFCVDHLKVCATEDLSSTISDDNENVLSEEDDEEEKINSSVNDEVVRTYFSRLVKCIDEALVNPEALSLHVITMSDAIREFAVDSSDPTDELCTAPMPRRSIRQFYALVEQFTVEAAKTDDEVQLRRLISLLLITHSKKVIDQCARQLNRTRVDLTSNEMESLCSFFWSCFLPNPREFRAYAISTALQILCKRFKLPVNVVMTRFCLLVSKTSTLAPYCDSVLSDVFIGSMSFVNFRQAYDQLLQQKRFDFHQTWNVIFEGLFSSISQPLPISYFQYRDSQVLNNMISELTIANDTKMPLIQRVYRFHWSLLLLERMRTMGPPRFDKDQQTQGFLVMSHQYANLLSPYERKGVLGAVELTDTKDELRLKAKLLAEWIKAAKCCVVFTGAGISTAAGIPDFRGPNGIWTREKQTKSNSQVENSEIEELQFENAIPTFTHRVLVEMERKGYIKFLLTQNVDGLHSRFGFPIDRLAEVHGNVFVERCDRCQRQNFRDTPLLSVGRKSTGRNCERSGTERTCRGKLCDFLLDWEDELPEPELTTCYKFASASDLSLCLGTSLQIEPVAKMPLLAKRNGGKFVTVNLQQTKHEKKADMAIHGKVDEVMRMIAEELKLTDCLLNESIQSNVQWKSNCQPYIFSSRKRKQQA